MAASGIEKAKFAALDQNVFHFPDDASDCGFM
jgi:hypothetical protein